MHRSTSQSRVAEEFYTHAPPPSSKLPASLIRPQYLEAKELLPTHDPTPNFTKKEKYRAKFEESSVHIIPLVLLLCGLILWFFSNPDINVGLKSDPIAVKIEGLITEGDLDSDNDGTQTGFLPVDFEEPDSTKTSSIGKGFRRFI